ARILADDHAFVDFSPRRDQNFSALLQIPDRIAGRFAGPVGYQRSSRARRNVSLPVDVAVKQRVHDRRAFGVRQHLTAKPDQTARWHVEFQTDAPGPVIDHLGHLALALAHLLYHHADEIFGTIAHQ